MPISQRMNTSRKTTAVMRHEQDVGEREREELPRSDLGSDEDAEREEAEAGELQRRRTHARVLDEIEEGSAEVVQDAHDPPRQVISL